MLPIFRGVLEKSHPTLSNPLHLERSRIFKFGKSFLNMASTRFKFELHKINSTRFGKCRWLAEVASIVFNSNLSLIIPFIAARSPVQICFEWGPSNEKHYIVLISLWKLPTLFIPLVLKLSVNSEIRIIYERKIKIGTENGIGVSTFSLPDDDLESGGGQAIAQPR